MKHTLAEGEPTPLTVKMLKESIKAVNRKLPIQSNLICLNPADYFPLQERIGNKQWPYMFIDALIIYPSNEVEPGYFGIMQAPDIAALLRQALD